MSTYLWPGLYLEGGLSFSSNLSTTRSFCSGDYSWLECLCSMYRTGQLETLPQYSTRSVLFNGSGPCFILIDNNLVQLHVFKVGSQTSWAYLLLHVGLQVSEGAPVRWSPGAGARCSPTLRPLTVYTGGDDCVSHLWFILQPNKSGQR